MFAGKINQNFACPDSPAHFTTLLVGARASGKSTIGPLLAKRVSLPFIDLDNRVLARFAARSIREVWQTRGEPEWRTAEATELDHLLSAGAHVIALGGGTPMIPQAHKSIVAAQSRRAARVIYLACSADVLQRRILAEPGDRPSLTGAALHDEIATMLAQREPTYKALADAQIDTSDGNPSDAVERIVQLFFRPGV